ISVATNGTGAVHITDASSVHVGAPLSQAVGVIVNIGASVTTDAGSTIEVEGPTGGSSDQSASGVAIVGGAYFAARQATIRASPRTLSATVLVLGGTVDIESSTLLVPPGEHGPVLFAFPLSGATSITVSHSRLACQGCNTAPVAGMLLDAGAQLDATF